MLATLVGRERDDEVGRRKEARNYMIRIWIIGIM
jgi:hypothetical protein